jgi:hypothetical protein
MVTGMAGEIKGQVGPQHMSWFTQSPLVYKDLAERYRREGL